MKSNRECFHWVLISVMVKLIKKFSKLINIFFITAK